MDEPLTVLCVDDEENILKALKRLFRKESFRVVTTTSGTEGLAILQAGGNFGLILSDQRMPEMTGTAFLSAAAAITPQTPRILLTGYADLQSTMGAVNQGGVSRIICKPWEDHDILLIVRDTLQSYSLTRENRRLAATIKEQNDELAHWNSRLTLQVQLQTEQLQRQLDEITRLKQNLETENIHLRAEVLTHMDPGMIIGASEALNRVLMLAERVAPTDSTVLIQGETGTGKELIANCIHRNSRRSERVMHKINCAAIPENLLESELFGREKGAFTGAVAQQIGHFELADGSTLFLDEVGELPLIAQAKLLRVLQEGQFERLGSPKTHQTDVRVIAATNRDLAQEVRQGRFREDLFYRLNVFPIKLPLLRERSEDIPLLVCFFVRTVGEKMGRTVCKINPRDMEALQRYPWPGNIRELRNCIEHSLIFSSGDTLQVILPEGPQRRQDPLTLSLQEVEQQHITAVLGGTNWRVHGEKGAARILGLNPNTLFFRMKKLGIPLLSEQRQQTRES